MQAMLNKLIITRNDQAREPMLKIKK